MSRTTCNAANAVPYLASRERPKIDDGCCCG